MAEVTYSFPRSSELKVPEICALCAGRDPQSHFEFASYPKGAFGQLLYLFALGPKLELRLHSRCRRRVWWREAMRRIIVVAVPVLPFVAHYAGIVEPAMTAMWVAVGLPLLFWQIFWSPKPVEVCSTDRHLEVRFRNAEFAVEFAMLNREALVWQAGKKVKSRVKSSPVA